MILNQGIGIGTKKIDADKVTDSVSKITNGMKRNIQNVLLTSMNDVSNLINSGEWDSPAKNELCDSLIGILLDNYTSIENSIGNLNNYIAVIISNYQQLELGNADIFRNLF